MPLRPALLATFLALASLLPAAAAPVGIVAKLIAHYGMELGAPKTSCLEGLLPNG